jgi:hypothetical protein
VQRRVSEPSSPMGVMTKHRFWGESVLSVFMATRYPNGRFRQMHNCRIKDVSLFGSRHFLNLSMTDELAVAYSQRFPTRARSRKLGRSKIFSVPMVRRRNFPGCAAPAPFPFGSLRGNERQRVDESVARFPEVAAAASTPG